MKAAIVAPVSRGLVVSDIARAAAFYRDVLGFAIHGTEAVNGPALLRLEQGAPESAIVFLETDDVEGMRAEIRARGGTAGEIAKVNWIKMQMFQVQDPDGNMLWFGKSYDKPHHETGVPMFEKALPRLPVSDVPAGMTHYRDALGFGVNYVDNQVAVMDRDRVTVLLVLRTADYKGVGSAYFYVENADKLCAEMRASGANVQGDPVSFPWGLREFSVKDIEGNELYFGQTFE
jgi:predicted enzyme related to lactoylglutathione lyase